MKFHVWCALYISLYKCILRTHSCCCRDCSRPPPVQVNLEVWLRTGERIAMYAPEDKVRTHGFLGPITRWGLYTNQEAVNRWPMVSNLLGYYEALVVIYFTCVLLFECFLRSMHKYI